MRRLWTIGHSTRTHEAFFGLLAENRIDFLIDVRSYPSSKFCPQWNKGPIIQACSTYGVDYRHSPELGGKRSPLPLEETLNRGLRNSSFRGYADYMQTREFIEGMIGLQSVPNKRRVAIMCSEAVWWRCHRSMISDLLSRSFGVEVEHIMSPGTVNLHPYREMAVVHGGYGITYPA